MSSAAQEFAQLLQQIRNNECEAVSLTNDPDLDNDACARELGEALNHSGGVVDTLYLSVHQLTAEGDYESLLEWISGSAAAAAATTTSSKLQEITLDGNGDYTLPVVSPVVVARFLRAIQTSATIQKVELVGCPHVEATVFATFVQTTRATELEMDCAVFLTNNDADTASGKDEVARAFRNNKSLLRLYLEITEETQMFVIEVIRELAFNDTLQHLALEWSPPEQRSISLATTRALEVLLSRSSTLQYLELQYFEFIESDRTLEPLVRGLKQSCIQKLSLHLCRLDDSATLQLEQAIVAETNQLQSLALPQSQLGTSNNERTLPMLTNILNAPSSSLTALQLDSPRLPNTGVAEFVQAVQNCPKLRSLSLDYLKNDCLYRELIRRLPAMRHLRDLRLHLANDLAGTERRSLLMNALRRNGSLTGTTEILPFAVPSHWNRRNRGVEKWLSTFKSAAATNNNNNKTAQDEEEAKFCPEIFRKVAEMEHGNSWIFRSLVGLGDAVGPQRVNMKGAEKVGM